MAFIISKNVPLSLNFLNGDSGGSYIPRKRYIHLNISQL